MDDLFCTKVHPAPAESQKSQGTEQLNMTLPHVELTRVALNLTRTHRPKRTKSPLRGPGAKIHPWPGLSKFAPTTDTTTPIDDLDSIRENSGEETIQTLRRYAQLRLQRHKAVENEQFERAADLKDEEDKLLESLSKNNGLQIDQIDPTSKNLNADFQRDATESPSDAPADKVTNKIAGGESKTTKTTKMIVSTNNIVNLLVHEQDPCIYPWNRCSRKFRTMVVESLAFQIIVFSFIFLATAAVGTQTHYNGPTHVRLAAENSALKARGDAIMSFLDYLDIVVVEVFLIEAVMKITAEGSAPFRYFSDMWNIFDMTIVAVGFLPFDTRRVMALRLLRLLRILKMVRALPQLQVILVGIGLACKQLVFVGGLMMLFFYLFAIFGFILFAENDPVFYGDLMRSMLTLWQITTGDDWTEVMYTNMFGCNSSLRSPHYADRIDLCLVPADLTVYAPAPTLDTGKFALTLVYFLLFFVISSIMLLNLVVGVIMLGMMEAKEGVAQEKMTFKVHSFKRKPRENRALPSGGYFCRAVIGIGKKQKKFKTETETWHSEDQRVLWDASNTFPTIDNIDQVHFEVCHKRRWCGKAVALWQLRLDFSKIKYNIPYRCRIALEPCAPPGCQPSGKFILRFDIRKSHLKEGDKTCKVDHLEDEMGRLEEEVTGLYQMVKRHKIKGTSPLPKKSGSPDAEQKTDTHSNEVVPNVDHHAGAVEPALLVTPCKL